MSLRSSASVRACAERVVGRSKPGPHVLGAWLLLLLAAPFLRAAESEAIAGPFAFVRGTGNPVTEEVRFIVPADVSTCIMRVDNDAAKSVTSADVVLNGATILGPNDFAARPERIERQVNLTATSVLAVKLRSAPTSSLRISFISKSCWLQPVFGPERFTRATGKPVTVQRTIASAGGQAVIKLINGDGHGVDAVSSADIRVDGEQIFRPSDFNQQVRFLSAAAVLKQSSTLCAL